MECPSCGAEVRDPEAVFCARCGASLEAARPAGDDATTSSPAPGDPAGDDATTSLPQPGDTPASSPPQAGDEPAAGPTLAPPTTEHPTTEHPTAAPPVGHSYDPGPPPAPRPTNPQGPPSEAAPTGPYWETARQVEPHSPDAPLGPDTAAQPGPPPQGGTTPSEASVPVRDFALALQRSFVSGGWTHALGAAAIGFLTLMGAGALIVGAIALGAAEGGGLGPNINALDVLSLVVIFGLSVMGVNLAIDFEGGLDVGGAEFSMVWLGALLVVGYALVWATARAVTLRPPQTARAQMAQGAKIAVPFALSCLVAALLFKLTEDGSTFSASAPQALTFGLFWGALFGGLGGLRSAGSLQRMWGRGLDLLKTKRRWLYEGVAAGGIMLGTTALAAAAAFLVIIIVGLARDETFDELTVRGVIAALVLLLLTLPNVLSVLASVALGAPLASGLSGGESLSIIGLGGTSPGAPSLLLLLVPLLSCLLGGFSAYRHSIDRARALGMLSTAALTYAGALALLSLVNHVTFDSGFALVDRAGNVSTNFFAVLMLGLIWAGAAGAAGWKLAELQEPNTPASRGPRSDDEPEHGYAPPGYRQPGDAPVQRDLPPRQ